MKQIFSSRYFFWALLALPALPMIIALSSDPGAAEGLLHPSGEFSARFMIIAMMITPLRMILLAEFFELGIWTGWLAFAIFVPLGLTSNNISQRWLLKKWKTLQRFVYPAAVLTLAHWIFVHDNLGPALVNFLPLAALEAWRIWKNLSGSGTRTVAA